MWKRIADLRPPGWCYCGHSSANHPPSTEHACAVDKCPCDFYYDYWPMYPEESNVGEGVK